MKLIDTSVPIGNLRKGVFEEGAISVITLIEVLRGVSFKKRKLNSFLKNVLKYSILAMT